MREDDLRAALRATALAVEPAPGAWEDNQRRLRTSRRWRAALGAGAVAAAACAAVLVLLGDVLPGDGTPVPDRLDQIEVPPADTRPLSVALSTSNAGPLQISLGEPSAGTESWQEHAFVVRNTSAQTVHVNDPRFSRFVGDRQLLVGLGCGYGVIRGVAAEGCFADYRPRSLAPGEAIELPMLLFRDLPGTNPLHSGRFGANADLSYRTGAPFTSLEDGAGASVASVSLAYTVRDPVTGTDVRAGAPFSAPGVVPPGCLPGGVPQDNVRCELPGDLRVDVVEAELVGPVSQYASAEPDSDTGISYGPHVAVTLTSDRESFAPGLAYGAVSTREVDGEGAIGLGGLCGRGWQRDGGRIAEEPCSALTPVTFFGAGSNDAFGFSLYPRVGDRSVEPGTYELVLPLDREPAENALRLVLVVSSVASP